MNNIKEKLIMPECSIPLFCSTVLAALYGDLESENVPLGSRSTVYAIFDMMNSGRKLYISMEQLDPTTIPSAEGDEEIFLNATKYFFRHFKNDDVQYLVSTTVQNINKHLKAATEIVAYEINNTTLLDGESAPALSFVWVVRVDEGIYLSIDFSISFKELKPDVVREFHRTVSKLGVRTNNH